MQTGAATEEDRRAGPRKVQQDYHKTQQPHPEEHDQEKLQHMSSPSRFGSVDRASACQLKSSGLIPIKGTCPSCGHDPLEGGVLEADQ